MIGDDRIDEILDRYEMLRERGDETPVEELCDDPEICAEVLRRLAALRAFDTFLRDSTTEKPPLEHDGQHEIGQERGKNDAKLIDFDAGRYTPLRFHAEGGLGRIYLARDCELKRDVALKRINARQARDEHNRQRFELEAEITGRLEHPGIVPVYGFGVDRTGQPYYAMRYIRGENLGDAITRYFQSEKVKHPSAGQRTDGAELRTLLRRFLAVCETIAYAHSRGIVHRDLKPANIMLGKYGETLVVDWGLAKPFAIGGIAGTSAIGQASEGGLEPDAMQNAGETVLGTAKGSPIYMSPEQAAGQWGEVGPASDIYSLGATLYHLLTGVTPFTGRTVGEILQKVKAGEFLAPRKVRSEIAPALEAICLKAMSKTARQRYATALDLSADIENWLADEPVTAFREPLRARAGRWMRRHRTAMSTVGAAAIVAVLALAVATGFLNDAWGKAEERRKEADRQSKIAKKQAELADKQADLAKQQKKLADEARAEAERLAEAEKEQRQEIEQNLYRSLILLADREMENNNVARATELLDETAAELRDWEWRHLKRRISGNLLTIADAHPREASDAVFSPDGSLIATAGGGEWEQPGEVKLWNAATGELLMSFVGHKQIAWRAAFDPSGKMLASTSRDGTARLWSIPDGAPLHVFEPSGGVAFCTAFDPEGKRLAIGGNRVVYVYDVASKELLYRCEGHSGLIFDVAFSKETNLLASCSSQWDGGPLSTSKEPSKGEVKIWTADTGAPVLTIENATSQEVGCLSFSPDGKLLAGADRVSSFATLEPTGVKVWGAQTGIILQVLHGHEDRIQAVAFDPSGKYIASGGDDETVRLWDIESGKQRFVLRGHTGQISRLAFSPGGDRLISAGDYDRSVRVWDSSGATAMRTFAGDVPSSKAVSFSSDSRRAATIDGIGRAIVWNVETGKQERAFSLPDLYLQHVAFSPADPAVLLAGSGRETLALWNVETGERLGAVDFGGSGLGGFPDSVQTIEFTPDGRLFAVGSWTQASEFFDAATRERVKFVFEGHERAAHDIAFSPVGKRMATCGENQIRVWDYSQPQGKLLFRIDRTNLQSVVQFSHDGALLAASGSEDYVQLFDGITGEPRIRLARHATGWINAIAFHPGGRRVATGGNDGNVKLWDLKTGRELLNLRHGPLSSVQCLTFSPDGRWLAAGVGGKVIAWDAGEAESVEANSP